MEQNKGVKFIFNTLIFALFIVATDMLMINALLPKFAGELGITNSLVGNIVASYSIGFALVALLITPMSDSIGRKRVILIGLMIFGAGQFISAISNEFMHLLVARAIVGIGAGLVMPNIWALVSGLVPMERLGKAMGLLFAVMSLAAIVGIPMNSLLAEELNLYSLFIANCLMAVAVFVLVSLWPKMPGAQHVSHNFIKNYWEVLSEGNARSMLTANWLWNFSLYVLYIYIGVILSAMNYSVIQIALVYCVAGVANFAGALIGGKAGDKHGKTRIVSIASLFIMAFTITFSLTNNASLLVSTLLVWSFFVGFGMGSMQALVSMQNMKLRTTLMSMNTFLTNFAMFMGAVVGGALISINHGSFAYLGVSSSLAALLVLIIVQRYDRAGALQKQMSSL